MYRLIRKNDQFCFVDERQAPENIKLIKSIFYPPWDSKDWRMPSVTEKKLWSRFIDSGQLAAKGLDEKILNSWQRCRSLEVDPTGGSCRDFLNEKELVSRNERLIKLSEPIIQTLYHCLRGSAFVIVLIDADGYILRTCGELNPLRQAGKLCFGPGANWSEVSVGTNAIGTAIVIKRPVQVSGVEHYCESHHLWTCAAAPIRDHQGDTIGYIDISGPQERANVHQLGLIVAAASAIEERICLECSKDNLFKINKYLEAVLNSVNEGVITTNSENIITGVNKVAAKTFQLLPSEIIGKNIHTFVQSDDGLKRFCYNGHHYEHEPLLLRTPKGELDCIASANPILPSGGHKCGAVLTFSITKRGSATPKMMAESAVKYTFKDIIGQSNAIRQTLEQARRFAQSPSNILILGESGTGKELFAQAIHSASDHRNGPFVSVNCGAIAKDLIQSELFGYENGAFTGAKKGGSVGKFEMANGGSLFLDEIGEMPFEMQVNLLRVLEERTVVPVGGKKAIPVDVRIIAATNKSLFEEVSKGNFREDLYYRLNVISIALPPLRRRTDDIRILTQYHVKKKSRNVGKEIKHIDDDVFLILEKYHWPGNVRELVNALEYAINFVEGDELLAKHLPQYLSAKQIECRPADNGKIMSLSTIEKKAIEKTLHYYKGNVTKAAKALEIGRNTLYDKMRKYGI